MLDFKQRARMSLERAKQLLAAVDPHSTRYAALELRMSLEALTYDRAQAYESDLPPKEYLTWQPSKLLQALMEIDPNADQSAKLFIGIEEVRDQPAKEFGFMGEENVLSLKTIKAHYDALGSFLHSPTRKQLESGDEGKLGKLKQRCAILVGEVEKALSGNMQHLRLGLSVEFQCRRCGIQISRMISPVSGKRKTYCFHCHAEYELSHDTESGETTAMAKLIGTKCAHCQSGHGIWNDDLKSGYSWTCEECGKRSKVSLCTLPAT